MLTGIVRFEWRYHTRRLTFAAAAAFFAMMGFMLAASRFGPQDVHVNAPYTIAQSVGLLSLVCVFALTLFSAQSLLRDTEHRMAEVVYTTSVTKAHYLFGRFAGSLLAAAAAFAFAVVGMVLGTVLPAHDPARLGPFDALDYLWAFAVLAVPNMLFVSSLLFAVAALTRSTLATYVGGVFVYMLYFVAAIFTDSPLMAASSPPTPEGLAVASLADPFGLSAFFEQTHYWTAAERNTRRLALEGHFLLNRLVWTGAAVVVLGLVYRLFAFRLPAGAQGKGTYVADDRTAPSAYRAVPVHAKRAAQWQAWWSATKSELRHVLRSWPFAVLMVMWVGVAAMEIVPYFRSAEFGTALVPATGLLIGRLREPLALFGLLTIVYYSAELAWRERTVRMDEIVDATPAANAVFLLAKAAALALLVGVLTAAAAGVAALFQLASGYPALEPGLYASLLYFVGLPLVLVAVLALFIQTLAPNRYVGMLATLLAAIVLHRGAVGGPDHPLLRYAAAPEVPYSALNGFSPMAVSFTWFMVYWTAFAGLLALVTCGVWRRGTDIRLAPRLAALRRLRGGPARLGAAAFGLVFVTAGGFVFYQTNVLNAYQTAEQVNDWKADYERTYGHLEDVAQPSVVDVEAEVDLYPEERRYRVRGRYRLENRTPEAVDTVWVAVRRDVTRAELALAGRPPTTHDERFDMYAFGLERPLVPGAATELAYDLDVDRRSVTADAPDHGIVANGSFLLSTFVFPSVGYRRSYELAEAAERRRRGLPEHSRPTTLESARAAGLSRGNPERITLATTVSTPADQIAVAPGSLLETWEDDGRRFYRYRTDRPMRPYFAYVSARYAVERLRHGGVDVEVYYHPEHDANVRRFVEAATQALDYCTLHFGPYPLPHLRIVEVPAYWKRFAGLALPGVVYFVEDRGFLTDLTGGERLDVVTKRVAHEVSHQWWGHQLSPAEEPGASALVETLARYSELMVLKGRYGEASLEAVLSVELDRYLLGRTGGDEVPLYQVEDQSYLYYSKGALVMMALHDLVGEEAVNRTLRDLLAEAAGADDPPTSLDLLEQFYRVTPEAHHVLLDQWWKEVVLYDLRVESAAYEPLPGGRFRVRVRLEAAKSAVRDGEEVPLEMDEVLDVAVFSEHPNAATGADPLIYAGRHRIDGATELAITVDERPGYVGVDPFLRRIDRNRADNVRRVEGVPRFRSSSP